jgi:RND family efflux transporter MFP subunit
MVKANDVLARQDDRQYQADVDSAVAQVREARTQSAVAAAEIEQAKAEYELAQTTSRRFKKLREQKSAAQQEYDEAKANAAKALASVARAQSQLKAANAQIEAAEARERQMRVKLEETELRSPIDGVVAYLNVKPGYYFTPSLVRTDSESSALQTVPMVVIDTSVFEVTVNVPSYERGRVKPEQEALIALNGRESLEANANTIRGAVFSVNPAVSPGGRSVQVKIRTTKGTERLEDGVFVTVWIATEERKGVITIPAAALLYRDNKPFVFVVSPETQTVDLRNISLGLQGLMSQEVTSGVKAGELLVTDGRFQLTNHAPVEVLDASEKGNS